MFNFEDEMNFDEYYEAEEGLFGFSKRKSVEKLLSSVKKNIDKKCTSAEACDEYEAKISAEAEKFNEAMRSLADAAREYKDGTISKKELKGKVKPIVSELKKSCEILKLSELTDDNKNITDDEIAALKEFIEGAKKIISEKKASFSESGSESFLGDITGFIDACESMTIAEEGLFKDIRSLNDLRKAVKNMNINEKLKYVPACVDYVSKKNKNSNNFVPLTKSDIDEIIDNVSGAGYKILKKGKVGNVYYTVFDDKNPVIEYTYKLVSSSKERNGKSNTVSLLHRTVSFATLHSYIIEQIKGKYDAKVYNDPTSSDEPAGESMIFDDEYDNDINTEIDDILNDLF